MLNTGCSWRLCQHRRTAVNNFYFADDIVANVEEVEEADVLVDCLDTTTTWYKLRWVLI